MLTDHADIIADKNSALIKSKELISWFAKLLSSSISNDYHLLQKT